MLQDWVGGGQEGWERRRGSGGKSTPSTPTTTTHPLSPSNPLPILPPTTNKKGEGTHAKTPHHIKQILQLLQRRPLHHRPAPSRLHPRLDEKQTSHQTRGNNKPHRPHRPRKPDLGQQLPHHGRENQAPRTRPARRDPDRQAPLLAEVGRQDAHARAKQAPVAQAHAHALREEELPVRTVGEGGGEDAEDLQGSAQDENVPEVARVGETAGEGADEEDEEDLHRADPGDVGGGAGGQGRVGGVVGLEDAVAVDEAPCAHDD